MQALAASLVPRADGLGVWYLLGDETTEDEGPNMQQIPREEQSLFLKLYSTMGQAYSLHTPWALPTALRRGLNTVDHPHRGGPFFLLMPMNVQPIALQRFNLDELPTGAPPPWARPPRQAATSARPTPSAQPNGSSSGSAAARPGPGLRLVSCSIWSTAWRLSPRSRSVPCRISTRAT